MILGNIWVAAAGLGAHLYSAGIAGWDEHEDLRQRFGDDWARYRRHVRSWIPRWRPWYGDAPVATLYVASSCAMCSDVGRWFEARGVRGLAMAPAEEQGVPLTRITYRAHDGYEASGVGAVSRALEHINLGWAWLGFAIRLPGITSAVQLMVDASGGGPRRLHPLPGASALRR